MCPSDPNDAREAALAALLEGHLQKLKAAPGSANDVAQWQELFRACYDRGREDARAELERKLETEKRDANAAFCIEVRLRQKAEARVRELTESCHVEINARQAQAYRADCAESALATAREQNAALRETVERVRALLTDPFQDVDELSLRAALASAPAADAGPAPAPPPPPRAECTEEEHYSRCAEICRSMVIVGRAWTHDQMVAADALFAAAKAIRAEGARRAAKKGTEL